MTEPVSPLVGKPAADFTLSDLSGRKQRLSALKGKVVLLDFWATWCGPCRRELPTIVKLHKELSPRGLAVVAVNVGEPRATVSGFVKQNQLTLPVWLDSDTQVSAKYGASSIPTLVVIDRAGKVTAYKVGMRDEVTLRALVAQAGLK
jgi:thiol-disulfide isomerase/thioredoxin